MTTRTVKLIVFISLLVHGIGHIQGVVSSMGIKFTGSTSNISWLLKSLGDKTNNQICFILFLSAALMGISAALSFFNILFGGSNWQLLALITAIISSACLILFPNALAMFFNKAGAVLVNTIVFYSILFQAHWPSAIFED